MIPGSIGTIIFPNVGLGAAGCCEVSKLSGTVTTLANYLLSYGACWRNFFFLSKNHFLGSTNLANPFYCRTVILVLKSTAW